MGNAPDTPPGPRSNRPAQAPAGSVTPAQSALRATFGKFWRYFLTAGTAAIVDVGGFAALVATGMIAAPAAAASFAAAACVNYALTSWFVYRTGLEWRRFTTFLVTALVGLAINMSVTLALFHGADLPAAMAKLGGVGFAFAVNFAMVNFVVYRRKSP